MRQKAQSMPIEEDGDKSDLDQQRAKILEIANKTLQQVKDLKHQNSKAPEKSSPAESRPVKDSRAAQINQEILNIAQSTLSKVKEMETMNQ